MSASPPIYLNEVPAGHARALVAGGAPVYVLLNPVEYHGPHLSLSNDRYISRALMARIHQALEARGEGGPLLLADDIPMGVEPCPGPGSVHESFQAVRTRLLAACERVADLGAERVVILTFHGSPLHNLAVEAGVKALRARGIPAFAPLHAVIDRLLELDPELVEACVQSVEPAERGALEASLAHDYHGGFVETSLALALCPEAVSPKLSEVPPCPPIQPRRVLLGAATVAARLGAARLSEELRFAAHITGWTDLRPFPGYTGRPHLANAAAGKILVERVLELVMPALEATLFEGAAPPRPLMPWLEAYSLGGRLPSVSVPLDAVAAPGWDAP